MFKEDHALVAPHGHLADQRVQLACRRNATHHRQMVSGLIHLQYRCLPTRGISLNHGWQQVKPRLINEHKLSALSTGLFFNSGQTSVRHCLIRLSSRWVARSRGFWGVHSISFSNRDTCDLEYDTPNSHLLIWAMRAQVKTSPRNPYASAPCQRNSGIIRRCAEVSLGGAPVWGRARNTPRPNSRALASHWLTAGRETPNALAILHCFQPGCARLNARRRRASFQS